MGYGCGSSTAFAKCKALSSKPSTAKKKKKSAKDPNRNFSKKRYINDQWTQEMILTIRQWSNSNQNHSEAGCWWHTPVILAT
jgi:hypothetical protein